MSGPYSDHEPFSQPEVIPFYSPDIHNQNSDWQGVAGLQGFRQFNVQIQTRIL
jgi:hypothetical protein